MSAIIKVKACSFSELYAFMLSIYEAFCRALYFRGTCAILSNNIKETEVRDKQFKIWYKQSRVKTVWSR